MVDMKQINSEIIYTARSKKFGIIGYLVIDSLIDGHSFGGVRIVSDISLPELQSVARSMTYKNAFIGNRIGGAKAAVIINKENEKYKKDILIEFGKNISPFVRNKMFFPVMDMGISINELQLIFDGTGYKCDVLSWKNLSHEDTAQSCFIATLCALEKKKIPMNEVTFSVQGFGNVGSTYAGLMYKAGCRLTAFSNKYYGLINDDGFDVKELIQEKSVRGDDFIFTRSKDKQVSHDSILEKDVTVLLPASNPLVINDENYKRIKADIIVCAANAPIPYDVERLLFKNGKIVITDFVANCGGILGSIMDNFVTRDTILNILSTYYKKKVESLINQSIDSNNPLVDIVIDEVEKRIDSYYGDVYVPKGLINSMNNYITDLFLNHISYPISKKNLSKRYISRYENLWRN